MNSHRFERRALIPVQLEQELEVVDSELVEPLGCRALQNAGRHLGLCLLQVEHALFDGLRTHELVDEHSLLLAQSVDPVAGLLFHGRIPVQVEQKQVVPAHQIQPHAAGRQRK